MFVNVNRTKIVKEKCNEVTSHLIFAPHKRQKIDKLLFDENGIFSKKIFGNFYKCDCGNLVGEEGICHKCGTRVILNGNIPDFYIDLGTKVPVLFADYIKASRPLKIPYDDFEDIMNYNKFVYLNDDQKNEIIDLNKDTNVSQYDESRVFIGVEALRKLGVSNEWIEENTVDYINIPHTVYRPLIVENMSTPFITDINKKYSYIIKKINDVKSMHELSKNRPFYLMSEYRVIVNLYNDIINSIIGELQDIKYSIVKSEVIAHPISGAIRAVLINRADVHEDVMIIGDTFIETLFPYLYEKHNGNMIEINKEFVDKDYVILVNRPPTINHLSTIGLKPRIASIYPFGHTEGTDGCLLHNYLYCEQNKNNIGVLEDENDELGDIERFGQGIDDDSGIDMIGLRTVGMNPIAMDGMGADTDGDCLLEIALYSKSAIDEAKEWTLPSVSYLNYANGEIRNHIIEDFIYTEDK